MEANDRAAKERARASGSKGKKKGGSSHMSSAEFHAYQVLLGEKKDPAPFASGEKKAASKTAPKKTASSTDGNNHNKRSGTWGWTKQGSVTERMGDEANVFGGSVTMGDNSVNSNNGRPLSGSLRRLRNSNRSATGTNAEDVGGEPAIPEASTQEAAEPVTATRSSNTLAAARTSDSAAASGENIDRSKVASNPRRSNEEDIADALMSGEGQVGETSCCVIL
eukprot:Sro53_g031430.2  (222) ;mRNA; r:83206-83871